MKHEKDVGEAFADLVQIMARLRGENGCPWDREQSHRSLKPFLVEEAYELLEAIDGEDPKEMEEELGDVLLQILFHCQIASEQDRFDVVNVLTHLREKLIRRHPHVFSDSYLPDSQSVLRNWVKAKAQERKDKENSSPLGKLPKEMPALMRAQRVGERAAHLGFDWTETKHVWDKVEEELGELRMAIASRRKDRVMSELGDVLLTLVSLSRFLKFEAEEALTQSLDRFVERFHYLEKDIRNRGKTILESSADDLDALWKVAKKNRSTMGKKPLSSPSTASKRKRSVKKGRSRP